MTNIAREDGLASWFGATQTLLAGLDQLAERCGWDVPLDHIRRRLRCRQCGRRADRLMLGHEQAAVPD